MTGNGDYVLQKSTPGICHSTYSNSDIIAKTMDTSLNKQDTIFVFLPYMCWLIRLQMQLSKANYEKGIRGLTHTIFSRGNCVTMNTLLNAACIDIDLVHRLFNAITIGRNMTFPLKHCSIDVNRSKPMATLCTLYCKWSLQKGRTGKKNLLFIGCKLNLWTHSFRNIRFLVLFI